MLTNAQQIGRYKIISHLGAGGMGEVYLGEDTKLGRKIALKILPESIASDKERLGRFEQEARAASSLNHPNILTVYEFGFESKVHFLATEYVEGETLREKIKSSELSLIESLNIAEQVAFALGAAHSAGIVHRDLKPENVMIRRDGIVKILDFGLAKLIEKKKSSADSEAETRALIKTNPGVIMGTALYMSPEQAKGKEADERTDIWSLGCVLYEMVSGKPPFTGEMGNEVIASILKSEHLPLSRYIPDLPAELERIVGKTLRKNRDERYQHIKDLQIDLKDLRQDLEFQAKLERSTAPNRQIEDLTASGSQQATQVVETDKQTDANAAISTKNEISNSAHPVSSAEYVVSEIRQHKRGVLITLSILLLAMAGLGFWYFGINSKNARSFESIAVMPFVNTSGNSETEYLSDGMTETLINSLSQIPELSVKARSSVFRYKGKDVDPQQIGSELAVQAILNGRVLQRGDQLTLNLELVDVKTGNQIWGEQYNRKTTDLVALQSEIARDVSSKLQKKLAINTVSNSAKKLTADSEAYQLYLKGLFHWNKRTPDDLKKAIEYFNQAKEKDHSFALAYAGLAVTFSVLPSNTFLTKQETNEANLKAKAAALKALELDNTLAEAHAVLAMQKTGEWDFAGAEKEYKKAIELNPNYATAYQWYSELLARLGRYDEAFASVKKAYELDPFSTAVNMNVGLRYAEVKRFDEAISQFKKTIEISPDYPMAYWMLSEIYFEKGMYEESFALFSKGNVLLKIETPESAEQKTAALRQALKTEGVKGYWRKILEFELDLYERGISTPFYVAGIYARLGEKEKAFEWLEKSYAERDYNLTYLKTNRNFESLHSDPRFQDLLRRVGLPQ
jgi:eukaryotic-like serine/threonine-protein kinase